MRISEILLEAKTLDPEIYGEMLPGATISKIVRTLFAQKYPGVIVKARTDYSGDGVTFIRAAHEDPLMQEFKFDVACSADGGTICVIVENGFAGPYKGIIGEAVGLIFKAAIRKWGTPQEMILQPYEDAGHGVWQHIAQKLGVKYEPGKGGVHEGKI